MFVLLLLLVVISGCIKQNPPVTSDSLKQIIQSQPEIKEMETQYKHNAVISVIDSKDVPENEIIKIFGSSNPKTAWIATAEGGTNAYLYQVDSKGNILAKKIQPQIEPERCIMPLQLACTDFSISSKEIKLILQNNAGRDMTIKSIKVTGEAIEGACEQEINKLLKNSSYETFGVGCSLSKTGKEVETFNLDVTAVWGDSTIHRYPGGIKAKVSNFKE